MVSQYQRWTFSVSTTEIYFSPILLCNICWYVICVCVIDWHEVQLSSSNCFARLLNEINITLYYQFYNFLGKTLQIICDTEPDGLAVNQIVALSCCPFWSPSSLLHDATDASSERDCALWLCFLTLWSSYTAILFCSLSIANNTWKSAR